MMSIQEEIQAEKASYLDWNEIRERQAEKEIHESKMKKIRAKKEQEIQKTKEYVKAQTFINIVKVIENTGIKITQEEINKYPHMGINDEIKNEWNNQVIKNINQTLHIRYCISNNPKISIEVNSETLHCKAEPIYETDVFGNKTDIIDIFCDPITIIHVKFDEYAFHLFETQKYNELYVAAKLIYLPQIITNGCIKYELQIKEDE